VQQQVFYPVSTSQVTVQGVFKPAFNEYMPEIAESIMSDEEND
jgi:hypothetical protein